MRRKTDSRKHSKILAARLGIAACASCFPVWTNGEECFLLRYSVQSSESKRLLVHRGVTATIARHDAHHFTFLSPASQNRRPFHRQISVPIYWDTVSGGWWSQEQFHRAVPSAWQKWILESFDLAPTEFLLSENDDCVNNFVLTRLFLIIEKFCSLIIRRLARIKIQRVNLNTTRLPDKC